MQRNQQQYDAVQEGSAQGVTSTISGPGETPQPLTTSTVTGTNVDTTTAFTVPGTTTTSTQQPGTIASTLPESTTGFPSGYTPPRPRPRPRTPPAPTDTAAPPTTTDTVAPTTTTDTVAPPPTDTTGTQGLHL